MKIRKTFTAVWRLAREDNNYVGFGLMTFVAAVFTLQLAHFLILCLVAASALSVVTSLALILVSAFTVHEMLESANEFTARMAQIDADHEAAMKKLREEHLERMARIRAACTA